MRRNHDRPVTGIWTFRKQRDDGPSRRAVARDDRRHESGFNAHLITHMQSFLFFQPGKHVGRRPPHEEKVMKFFGCVSSMSLAMGAIIACSGGQSDNTTNAGGNGGLASGESGAGGMGGAERDEPKGGGSAQGGTASQGGNAGAATGGATSSGAGGLVKPDNPGVPAVSSSILGTGGASAAKITALETATGCLNKPTDVAFNPRRKNELWATNYGDNSVCIVMDATATTLKSERRIEPSNNHYMPRPMAMAFGGDSTTFSVLGTFASANDSAGDGHPDDGKMWNGITLWSSDLDTFGKYSRNGGNSHLDMLHDSPLARGIAWEKDNIYWVFGAMLQDITRYDFAKDHDRGNADHSDGSQWHYAAGMVKGVTGVPSHMFYDPSTKLLYFADTGNKRVARLDTTVGTLNPKRHTRMNDNPETRIDAVMDGAKVTEVVTAGAGLSQPAGLDVAGKVLYVSDFATGLIYAFDLEGRKISSLDTKLGAGKVAGLAVGPDGKLYFASMGSNTLYVVAP